MPGLHVGAVHGVDYLDVLECGVQVVVWCLGVLADGSDGDTGAALAVDVLGVQVCGVALGGNTVVTVDDGGVFHEELVALPGVVAVCVHGSPLAVAGGVDEQVGHGDVLAIPDEGSPELGLDDAQAVDKQVGGVVEGDTHGTSGLVRLVTVGIVPSLTLTVVEAALAVEVHVGASEQPSGDLVLQNNTEGMGAPVGDVCRETKLATKADITVQEVGGVEDSVDVEGVIGEDDGSVGTAHLKGLLDRGRVIHGLAIVHKSLGVQDACCPVVNDPSVNQGNAKREKPQIHDDFLTKSQELQLENLKAEFAGFRSNSDPSTENSILFM